MTDPADRVDTRTLDACATCGARGVDLAIGCHVPAAPCPDGWGWVGLGDLTAWAARPVESTAASRTATVAEVYVPRCGCGGWTCPACGFVHNCRHGAEDRGCYQCGHAVGARLRDGDA